MKCSFEDNIGEHQQCRLFSFFKGSIKLTKPKYLGFCVLELIESLLYERCYEKRQQCSGEVNLKKHYIDTYNFLLSFKPIEGLIEYLKHTKEDFDLIDLDQSQELYSNISKKVIGKTKLETAPELNFLRSNIFKERILFS